MKKFYNEAQEWTEAFGATSVKDHAHTYKEVLKKISDISDLEEDYQFIGLSISAMAEDEKSNITDAEVENLQDLMMDLEDANRKFLNAAKKLYEKK